MWENPSKYQAWQTARNTGGGTEGTWGVPYTLFSIRWALGEVGEKEEMVVGLYRRRELSMYVCTYDTAMARDTSYIEESCNGPGTRRGNAADRIGQALSKCSVEYDRYDGRTERGGGKGKGGQIRAGQRRQQGKRRK